MKKHIFFISIFLLSIFTHIIFIIYSFAHVDLNLTLSTNLTYQHFQDKLTFLGFYNRSLSTSIFIGIILVYFITYGLIFWGAYTKKINSKQIWILVGSSCILIFSYPAFSYDLFNYIFDARIVTHYGLNPYFFKALDFPFDPWVRFMRWTHRYYPYGFGWLLISLIPSFLGFGKFFLTLIAFKIYLGLFHLGNCYLVLKISEKLKINKFALVLFAFNPLVIIESLVNPHNEVVMLFFVLLALYLFFLNRRVTSFLSIIISFSVKFLSIVLLPIFFLNLFKNDKRTMYYSFFIWFLAIIPLILEREAYGWYFVPLVALGLLTDHHLIISGVIAVSSVLVLCYSPFILIGSYTAETYQLQNQFIIVGILVFVTIHIGMYWNKKNKIKKASSSCKLT